jgi:6-phosphofructokinase 1
MTKRIAVLTSGGDAPAQNVCLKAIVYDATDRGYDVLGIRQGWKGLLSYDPDNADTHSGQVMILNKSRVRDIDRLPGSFLHTSRIDPAAVAPKDVPHFLPPAKPGDEPVDLTAHIKRAIAKLGVDALVVLGDRPALIYAARLSREGVPVIGIPKTVHNTVSGSDYALGFSTALARGVHFVQEIRAMAGSREEIAVIEILGRDTGLTTMLISMLAGVDRTLIPEVPFDPDRLANLLVHDKAVNPNNYAILIMSEATRVPPDTASKYLPELSRLANSRTLTELMRTGDLSQIEAHILADLGARRGVGSAVTGSGVAVTEILENITGQRLLLQPLSYLIRTGEPDGQDLLGALNFAVLAVQTLVEGQFGRLIAYRQNENYVSVPIDVVTQPATNIDLDRFYDAKNYQVKPGILWATRV